MVKTTLTAALAVMTMALLVPAFGQVREQGKGCRMLSAQEDREVRARVVVPDNNLPTVASGGFVVEAGPNGSSRRTVTLTVKNPRGQYLINTCLTDGTGPLPSGAFEGSPDFTGFFAMIVNGDIAEVLPWMSPLGQIEVVHIDGGRIERSVANVAPYLPPDQGAAPFAIVSETLTSDGKYALSLSGQFGPDATVIVGRYAIGDFRPTPTGGGVAIVDPALLPYNVGITTVTVCQSGRCGTRIYDRKVAAPQQPNSGKG